MQLALVLAIALTSTVQVDTTTAARVPPPPVHYDACSFVEKDIDYVGNDIANVPSAVPERCCEVCQHTPGCRVYTWTNFNGGTCWLKSSKGSIAAKPGALSSVVSFKPPMVCSPIESDVDYVGNDIGTGRARWPEGCCELCAKEPGCGAFTWTPFNGGTCWLKSSKGATVPKIGAKSSVYTPKTCGTYWSDTDLDGTDIGNVTSAKASGCCDACKASHECEGYAWSDFNGGTCWLKSDIQAVRVKPGVVAAKVPANAFTIIEEMVDYVGMDLDNQPASKAEDCYDICGNRGPRCSAFTWTNHNGGTCWLKSLVKPVRKATPGARSAWHPIRAQDLTIPTAP